jgi:hypothetical protein
MFFHAFFVSNCIKIFQNFCKLQIWFNMIRLSLWEIKVILTWSGILIENMWLSAVSLFSGQIPFYWTTIFWLEVLLIVKGISNIYNRRAWSNFAIINMLLLEIFVYFVFSTVECAPLFFSNHTIKRLFLRLILILINVIS